jgi:hypothetical protein
MAEQIIFPVLLHYPGAPSVRVNDERMLYKYQAQGWTLSPAAYVFQKYPTVLYLRGKSVDVNSDQERSDYIAKGYSPNPNGPFGGEEEAEEVFDAVGEETEDQLVKNIKYHLDQASVYQSKLDALRPAAQASADPVQTPEPKRRGRKKKGQTTS